MDTEVITFEEAVKILSKELFYSPTTAEAFAKSFDRNKDGKLSAAEVKQFRQKITDTKNVIRQKFKEYDVDSNGYITMDEAQKILLNYPFSFPASKVTFLLSKFDKDGNGKLDYEEFSEFYAEVNSTNEEISALFASLDTDGNGVLSQDEIVAILKEKLGFDDEKAKHLIKMFDTNKDGSLDKTEFMEMWSSMFGK